jgi:hypothetical protein
MIESELSKRFPISNFTDLVKEFGYRRLEFFSYSKEQLKTRSEIEMGSNYEYNIFNVLDEKIKASSFPEHISSQVVDKFKEIYDSLRNTKSYE